MYAYGFSMLPCGWSGHRWLPQWQKAIANFYPFACYRCWVWQLPDGTVR